MSSRSSLAARLGRLARGLLARLRPGATLALRLADDGRLLWRLPAEAWDPESAAAGLDELGAWSVSEREHALGPQAEIALDLGERIADFQSPEVLLELRAVAAGHADRNLRLELPAGVRDIQRARAGLDSARPSEGRDG